MIKITAAILTLREGVNLEEIPAVLKHEQEVIEQWKKEEFFHDMYLRQDRSGVVLMFKETDEAGARQLIETLPLFPYFKPIEFLGLLK